MHWFRSSRRPWGWVALWALALQLALSFGHVHGTRDDHPAAVQTATADGNASNAGDSSDTDYCATCAILALLTGSQIAGGPVFVVPMALASAQITVAFEAPRLGASRTAFHSRAPPLS